MTPQNLRQIIIVIVEAAVPEAVELQQHDTEAAAGCLEDFTHCQVVGPAKAYN